MPPQSQNSGKVSETAASTGAGIAVGAFGKHPQEPDHLTGIDLSTPLMRSFKQSVYDHGFEAQVATWMRLDGERKSIPWGHSYLFRVNQDMLIARLWQSSDAIGRSNYPMIVCAHARGMPADWVLGPALEHLRAAEPQIRAAASPQALQECVQKLGLQLRALAKSAAAVTEETLPAAGFKFVLASPQMGTTDAIHRVVCAAGDLVDATRQAAIPAARRSSFVQMRLPACAAAPSRSLLAWNGFFESLTGVDTPLTLIRPDRHRWVDALLGEPTASAFGSFRASEQVIPNITRTWERLSDGDRVYADRAVQLISQSLGEVPAMPADPSDDLEPDPEPQSLPQDHLSAERVADEADHQSSEGSVDALPASSVRANRVFKTPEPVDARQGTSRLIVISLASCAVLVAILFTAMIIFSRGPAVQNQQWRKALQPEIAQLTQDLNLLGKSSDLAKEFPEFPEISQAINEEKRKQLTDGIQAVIDARDQEQARIELKNTENTATRLAQAGEKQVAERLAAITNPDQFQGRPVPDYLLTQLASFQSLPQQQALSPEQSCQALKESLGKLGTAKAVSMQLAAYRDCSWPQPVFSDSDPGALTAGVKGCISAWLSKKQFDIIRNAKADDTPETVRKRCDESSDFQTARAAWHYWAGVERTKNDPLNNPLPTIPGNIAADLMNDCQRELPELQKMRDQIVAEDTASVQDCCATVCNQNVLPPVRWAAWQQISGKLDSLQLDQAGTVVKAVSALINSQKNNADATSSLQHQGQSFWLSHFKTTGQDDVAPLMDRAETFLVEPNNLDWVTDADMRRRIQYDLAACNFNKNPTADALKKFRQDFGSNDYAGLPPQVQIFLRPKEPAVVMPATTLPSAALAWTLGGKDDRRTLSEDKTHVLEFLRVDVPQDPGRDHFVCTTAFSVVDLKSVATDPEIKATLGAMKIPRGVLCAWEYTSDGTVVIRHETDTTPNKDVWCADMLVTPNDAPAPTMNSPVTYLDAAIAQKICGKLGCHLPAVAEWSTALIAATKNPGQALEFSQLRDAQLLRGKLQSIIDIEHESAAGTYSLDANTSDLLRKWGSFAADAVAVRAQTEPPPANADDKALWFRDVRVGSSLDGKFHDLVGNVAEWASDASDVADPFRIVGWSSLCAANTALNKKKLDGSAYKPDANQPRQFGDVGFRLAFDLPRETIAQKDPIIGPAPYVAGTQK